MKRFVIISVCLFLLSGLLFCFISLPHKTSVVTAEGGVLDLSGQDFSEMLFSLDGEWEFYYGKLYTPQDFTAAKVMERGFINTPSSWNAEGYPDKGFATYRLTILTDEAELAMLVPEIQDSAVLWVNGKKLYQAGVPGVSEESTVASLRNAFVILRPENGRAEIVVQAANYKWRNSGMYYSFSVGRMERLITDALTRRILMGLVLGIFLIMGLYHAVLFLCNRKVYGRAACLGQNGETVLSCCKEWAYPAFAVICLNSVFRFFLESNGIADLILPAGIGDVLGVALIESIVFHTIALIFFSHIVFDIKMKGRLRWAVYIIAFIISFSAQFTNPPAFVFYAAMIPFIWTVFSAARSRKLRENPYNALFFSAMIFYIVWNPFYMFVLDDSLFMPGIMTNLFLTLSQGVMLSVSYAETKRNEETLKVSNELLNKLNRTKTEFLQDMRHEMKNPLTVIAAGVDFSDGQIAKEGEHLSEVRRALGVVRDETQRLGRMVESMAVLASMGEAGENRERLDLAKFLEKSTRTFLIELEQKNINLKTEFEQGLPDVFIERDRFRQVIANLLSNAVIHTPAGGLITLAAAGGDKFITVRVSDNGSGIAEDMLPRVFERGVSGRGSTGYGLYLSKAVVEAHGGLIKIASKKGEGTEVTFTVPVYGGQEAGHERE